MNTSEWDEAVDEAADYEAADYESSPFYGEAKRAATPVKTAPRKSAYSMRPSGMGGNVTQTQLQTALARVSQQIAVNSSAIKTLDGRVRGVVTEQTRAGTMLRKETADRRKDIDSLRGDLQSTRELSALLPLVTTSLSNNPNTASWASLVPLVFLLPPDTLTGGSNGSSSSSSGSSSSLLGGNNLIAVLAIAAAALSK